MKSLLDSERIRNRKDEHVIAESHDAICKLLRRDGSKNILRESISNDHAISLLQIELQRDVII